MTFRRIAAFAALAWACGAARAQGSPEEEMKKRMEEIARLMRESEKLLLEITQVDRLVDRQREIVEKLKELEPPQQDAAAELKAKQEEIERKIQELFRDQQQKGEMTVKQLEELLRSLPRGGQGQPEHERNKEQRKEEERRLPEREEQKQQQARGPRDQKDPERDKTPEGRKPKDEAEAARLRRIEAWIARLPPEEQERLSRNDFSGVPARYRRLIREYTALRAKREGEQESDGR